MSKIYNSAISRQTARQIRRNREKNIPRLNQLKQCIGCMVCGKDDIPGEDLDGHHIDESRKYKSLSKLCSRRWLRVVREIFGINRDQPHGGGPCEFVCRRYHHERHELGEEDAMTCIELEKMGFTEPWKAPSRKPKNNKR
jgi:NAD-dependent dihydropyrimidine dehydrogenase PreA subunit